MSRPDRVAELIGALAHRDEEEQLYALRRCGDPMLRAFGEQWPIWAHEGQLPPAGVWRIWLMTAGRGFGKTRAGAEWVSELARTGSDQLRIAWSVQRPPRSSGSWCAAKAG